MLYPRECIILHLCADRSTMLTAGIANYSEVKNVILINKNVNILCINIFILTTGIYYMDVGRERVKT